MKYKVLKDFVSENGNRCFKKGETYEAATHGDFVKMLLENDFIEKVKTKSKVDFERWEREGVRSELANIIVAPEDYEEGDKKFFNYDEAMKKVEELNNGWRLPTNKEWNLLAWEFGEKDDVLDLETLRKNLNLELKGRMDEYGDVWSSGIDGYGWSSRAISSDVRYAYGLYFYASGVGPSSNANRWIGFPLRLVKDIEG